MGAILNWWLLAGELDPRWKGGHGGGEETAAMLAIDPSCVHMEYFMPFEPKDLSPDLTFAGSFNVNCNGVSVPVPRTWTAIRPAAGTARLPGNGHKGMGRRNVKGHSGFLRGLYKEV